MAVTINWSILPNGLTTSKINNQDIVTSVVFCVSATDGQNTAERQGVQKIKLDPEKTVIPFNNLTEEQVVSWVKENMDSQRAQNLENLVQSELNKASEQQIVSEVKDLPWDTNKITA